MLDAIAQGVHGLLEDLDLDPLVHNVLGTAMIVFVGLILWSAVAAVVRAASPASEGSVAIEDHSIARHPQREEQPKLETAVHEHRGLTAGSTVRVEMPSHVANGVVVSIVDRRFVGVMFVVQLYDIEGTLSETVDVPDMRVHELERDAVAAPSHPEVAESPAPPEPREQVEAVRTVQEEITSTLARRQRARRRTDA